MLQMMPCTHAIVPADGRALLGKWPEMRHMDFSFIETLQAVNPLVYKLPITVLYIGVQVHNKYKLKIEDFYNRSNICIICILWIKIHL